MTDKQHRIQALICSVVTYLKVHRGCMSGVDITLDKLAGMNLSDERLIDIPVSYTHLTLPTKA